MSRNTLFRLFEKAIPESVCDEIVVAGKQRKRHIAKVRQASGEDIVREEARKTQLAFWPATHWVNGLMEHHIRMANDEVWNYHVTLTQGVQFGIYGPGDNYDWHKDEFDKPFTGKVSPPWKGLARKVSAVLNLTDPGEYTGGSLQFKNGLGQTVGDEEFQKRLAQKGSLIVFPAYVMHTVVAVESGERCSLASWMLGKPFV